MMVDMIKQIIKSILIFSLISTACALPFSFTYLDFLKYFLTFSVIQFILNKMYITYLKFLSEKIKTERLREYSKQGTEITCPCYLEKSFLLPLKFNEVNSFNCLECKRDFTVDINTRSFMKTEAIDLDKSETEFINAIKKIQKNS